jgi:hypothetical protein
MFIGNSVLVLVHESFGIVLDIVSIVGDGEGVVRESRFLEVVLVRWRRKCLIKFVAECLICP